MPRQRPFSKKSSTTYALVHRPQTDPLIHDSSAPSHILTPINGEPEPYNAAASSSNLASGTKIKRRHDLEQEFGSSGALRDNEGEAAEHGIFYDDSRYDYMQHMRDLGNAGIEGTSTWLDPNEKTSQKNKKGKKNLEDALRDMGLDDTASTSASQIDDTRSLGGASFASSSASAWYRQDKGKARDTNYQSQQDVPDELAGFQPDMDPRLREALEALDDEAYVDDEDDLFAELAGGDEVDPQDWEAAHFDDDQGWESDDTERPVHEYSDPPPLVESSSTIPDETSATDGDWLESFAKSKSTPSDHPPRALIDATSRINAPPSAPASSILTASGTRHKKRKGARTSTTNFSMTSSTLARSEALSTLDSRFDRIEKLYMDEIDEDDELGDLDDTASIATGNMSTMSGMTGMSKASKMSGMSSMSRLSRATDSEAPPLMSADFSTAMDDFLSASGGPGKKLKKMRKGGREDVWGMQTGMDQLNEVRSGLGPARVSDRNRAAQRA